MSENEKGEILKDAEAYLHKIQMSQIGLADIIHDCKAHEDEDREYLLEYKYRYMDELERRMEEMIRFIKWFSEKLDVIKEMQK